MRIENTEGKPLNCLDDWKSIHKPTQWKEGRSAYSVADFIVNREGVLQTSRPRFVRSWRTCDISQDHTRVRSEVRPIWQRSLP